MVSDVEQVVAGRLPVRVTVLEVDSTVGCSVTPFHRNDWRGKEQAQDPKCECS